MIADALISYGNDHGHFPLSMYDGNKPWDKIISIADAWRKVTESWASFKFSWDKLIYIPWVETYKKVFGMTDDDLNNSKNFEKHTEYNDDLGGERKTTYKFIWDNKSKEYWIIGEYIDTIWNDLITKTNITRNATNVEEFAIVTQWMCISELKNYLVDNWYLSFIPNDPSWEELNLETNYCINRNITMSGRTNANDEHIYISKDDCYASGAAGCAKLCKEWYAYVSDWNHFALIAHMENENNWNYITTACGSCGVECKTSSSEKPAWTDTEQLPCVERSSFTETSSFTEQSFFTDIQNPMKTHNYNRCFQQIYQCCEQLVLSLKKESDQID